MKYHEPGEKILRVLTLLFALDQDAPGRRTTELAAELGVTQRSVQRYIKALIGAGIDIVSTETNFGRGRGNQVRWRIGRTCPVCARTRS
jgi:predicted DNA-binding transcriptional regulator YafY